VAAALAIADLTEDDGAYRQIVDPAGTPSEEALVAHDASSCMLVAAWLRGWRGRFVPDTIQTILRGMCGGTGRVPDVDNFVDAGAGAWWAAAPGHDEHVDACVIAVERTSLYAVALTVVAGGQRTTVTDRPPAGRRCISKLIREVVWDGSGWVDQGTGRRVLGVLDAGAS
jgi:hypothetical protein